MILPDTDKKEAYNIIKRILKSVRGNGFIYEDKIIKCTFSTGVADSSEIKTKNFNIKELIKIADKKLYMAKNAGRNRIVK